MTTLIFDNVSLTEDGALKATCPKHDIDMVQKDDGWFSVVWKCPKCKYPYQIRVVKMTKAEHQNLLVALKKSNKLQK